MHAHQMVDHTGRRLRHGRPRVNGVDIHYAIGGAGPPVYLIHGAPKTMFAWRHVIPLLTPTHTVVALDCRGYGDSSRPLDGYDTATMAADVAALAEHLGHHRFAVVGEDWGAAVGYVLAATHPSRVTHLVFQEMRLPGLDITARSAGLARDDTRTGWHFSFFAVPHIPELLMPGREREFWTAYLARQMYVPSSLTDADIAEVTDWVARPGGLHTVLSVYRAYDRDAAHHRALAATPLPMPVLAVGGDAYLADEPYEHMRAVATDAHRVVLAECGHNPALEAPGPLADALLPFLAPPAR
jgi:pimeloyl-ACP methyl ester carboxylesterase